MFRAIAEELRSIDTTPRTLRRFGLLIGCILVAIGFAVAWTGTTPGAGIMSRISQTLSRFADPSAPGALGLGGIALVLPALVRPRILRGPYLVWMGLALAMGFVMTRVLLTIVFLTIVTPIAMAMRIAGRDPMHRRPDPSMPTYWIRKEPSEDPRAGLEKYW